MIYAASLGMPVKKAFKDKCFSTNISKIIEQLKVDPDITGMNAVVLGPKDVVGINRSKVQAALNTKHEKVVVIYVYNKDKESDGISCPNKELIKKVTPEAIEEAVNKYLSKDIDVQSLDIRSRDSEQESSIEARVPKAVVPTGTKGGLIRRAAENSTKREYKKVTKQREIFEDQNLNLHYYVDEDEGRVYCNQYTEEPLSQEDIDEAVRLATENLNIPEEEPPVEPIIEENEVPVFNEVPKTCEEPKWQDEQKPAHSLEENLESIRDFHEWGLFKEALNKDAVVRELLNESASFAGIVQMLSVLDAEIKATFYDKGLTAEEKFNKIMEIGTQRSTFAAKQNDAIATKVIEIIEAISKSAKRTVEEKLYEHRQAIETLIVHDKAIADDTEITQLIHKRCQAEIELLALVKHIIALYQAMDLSVDTVIKELDVNLPSDNKFINNMIGAAGQVLTPENSKAVARRLMTALQEKRESMALLEREVYNVMDSIRMLLEQDKEIIERQQYMIRMLKAHHVEDTVVVDTVLKYALRLYVGAPQSGRTATVLTWSGCLARRANTLVIDMTSNCKMSDYGVDVISIEDFLRERINRPLCVVDAGTVQAEDLHEVVYELKTRLDYYAYINVLLDTDDMNKVNHLAEEALSISFITNCTKESLADIKECIKQERNDNVARKLIMIDPPVSPLVIAKELDADPTIMQCVSIPNIPEIRGCAILGDTPHDRESVRVIFEDAFR